MRTLVIALLLLTGCTAHAPVVASANATTKHKPTRSQVIRYMDCLDDAGEEFDMEEAEAVCTPILTEKE